MAYIKPITLTITPQPTSPELFVLASYSIRGEDGDGLNERSYRVTCDIIGDDTPGDGSDDVLATFGPDTVTFSGTAAEFERIDEFLLTTAQLDEDNNGMTIQRDEIRARITLVAPTGEVMTRESNQVLRGGLATPIAHTA
jgi:hypothetical protein